MMDYGVIFMFVYRVSKAVSNTMYQHNPLIMVFNWFITDYSYITDPYLKGISECPL